MSPADELRAAAKKLREIAARVPQGHDDEMKAWAGEPWRAEECHEKGCVCIIYQGIYPDDPFEPVSPPIQYVADAETEEHAQWIAMMHLGLAEPLAAWLESVADEAEAHEARGWGNDQTEIATSRILAIANVINGGTS